MRGDGGFVCKSYLLQVWSQDSESEWRLGAIRHAMKKVSEIPQFRKHPYTSRKQIRRHLLKMLTSTLSNVWASVLPLKGHGFNLLGSPPYIPLTGHLPLGPGPDIGVQGEGWGTWPHMLGYRRATKCNFTCRLISSLLFGAGLGGIIS